MVYQTLSHVLLCCLRSCPHQYVVRYYCCSCLSGCVSINKSNNSNVACLTDDLYQTRYTGRLNMYHEIIHSILRCQMLLDGGGILLPTYILTCLCCFNFFLSANLMALCRLLAMPWVPLATFPYWRTVSSSMLTTWVCWVGCVRRASELVDCVRRASELVDCVRKASELMGCVRKASELVGCVRKASELVGCVRRASELVGCVRKVSGLCQEG